jgi:hypothetical protein
MSDRMESRRRWAMLIDAHAADLVSYAQSLGLEPLAAQSLVGRLLARRAALETADSHDQEGLKLAVEREVERVRRSQLSHRRRFVPILDPLYARVGAMSRPPTPAAAAPSIPL